MADKKISQLTGAATPVAGTEVLPIVQSGSTVKVAISDLTAGRAISASGVTVSGQTASTLAAFDSSKNITSVTSAATTPLAGTEEVAIVQSGSAKKVSVANLTAGRSVSMSALTVTGDSILGNEVFRSVDNSYLRVAGGNPASIGGNLLMFGSTHASAAGRAVLSSVGSGYASLESVAGAYYFRLDSSGNANLSNGNLVVGTAAKGIDFSANTGAAGETSALLNWYEEGTWTPSVRGETGGAWSGQTGTFTGTYTRIGRMVTCNFSISLTATGSVAGNYAVIAGLPFTAGSPSGNAVISYWGPLTSNWTNIVGLASSTIIYLYGRKTAGTTQDVVFVSEITATTELLGTAIYFV